MPDETGQTSQSSSAAGATQQATSSQSGGSQQGSGSQSSQAGQTSQSSQATQSQQQAAPRPEYIPETHWDGSAGKVRDDKALATHFNEIVARDAAEQSRRLSLPQNADAYKVELPGTFQPPEGTKFEIDANNPLWAQARSWAHKNGISQEAFQEGIALIAGDRIATAQAVKTARDGEIAKLGATGPARVDAVTTVFKSVLGEADGLALASRIFTARDVEIAEKLVAKITGQGGAQYRASGREPPPAAGTKSPEEIAKMTPAQRLDYTRSFDQSRMPEWKDPRAA